MCDFTRVLSFAREGTGGLKASTTISEPVSPQLHQQTHNNLPTTAGNLLLSILVYTRSSTKNGSATFIAHSNIRSTDQRFHVSFCTYHISTFLITLLYKARTFRSTYVDDRSMM